MKKKNLRIPSTKFGTDGTQSILFFNTNPFLRKKKFKERGGESSSKSEGTGVSYHGAKNSTRMMSCFLISSSKLESVNSKTSLATATVNSKTTHKNLYILPTSSATLNCS